MEQYRSFIFDSYSFDPEGGKIELHYSLDDSVHFTETILLPASDTLPPTPPREATLFALHLIGGISYYKTCCPKTIEIRSGNLTKEQADFWNTVYSKGLGEFFFRNKIDFRGLINFPSALSPIPSPMTRQGRRGGSRRLLVPLGGGKDSTVTVELLKKAGEDVTLFRIGHHPLIKETAKIAGLPMITVERHLAPELFRLNAEGALNGHVPITAYLSILTAVIAELYGFDAVVLSNERSASEGNTGYLGEKINHQWSKSLEFERMLRQELKNIGSPVEYFSLLRPLSELSIAKIFATLPQYFPCTTSCNTNWKLSSIPPPLPPEEEGETPYAEINNKHIHSPSPRERGQGGEERIGRGGGGRWCGICPKCAFAFAVLAAFIPKEKLLAMFGKDLFDEDALQPFYRELLGLEGFKPFECVGTPEETQAAFLLAHEHGDLDRSKAMKLFLEKVMPTLKQPKKLIEEALKPSSDHCIPTLFQSF